MAFMMRRPVRSLKYKNINFLWAAPVRPICIFKSAFSQHFHTGANSRPRLYGKRKAGRVESPALRLY
jgi:hypothetical protein